MDHDDPVHDDLPAAPSRRSITPSHEDFASTPGFLPMLWPLLWLALAIGLYALVSGRGWTPFHGA